jgi:ArsR family transcriptional regulator
MNKALVKTLKALADPTRIKIVKILRHRNNMCVCELQYVLGITQPGVSKHLKVLENAGIVEPQRYGMWVNYSLSNGKIGGNLEQLLKSVLSWVDENEQDVAQLIATTESADRLKISSK